MRIRYIILSLIIFTLIGCSSKKTSLIPSGNYLGQKLPQNISSLFAEDIISTEFNVRDAAFSPDGNEFFYSIKGSSFHSIILVERINDSWQNPVVAPFSGKYSDIEPCFSPNGRKLFFVSNRPIDGEGEPKDYDIWFVEKDGNKWGPPQNIGPPVNTSENEFYPSFTKDGTMYFCARYENGIGGEDLYFSKFMDGKFQEPVILGDSVNSVRDEFNSFVSPDGRYIMFTSTGWGQGFGGGDLWISFNSGINEWSRPINMGENVNSPFFEYCPSLTPDGKYLFYTSNRSTTKNYSSIPLSYDGIINGLQTPLNGSQNIYWISVEFIDNLGNR